MEISIGEIILDEEIKLGNIELDVVKEYPYLENLEITPTAGQQIFTHPDSYGYNEVKVDAINLQDKSVTPTQAQQIIFADIGYSGLNNVKIEAATSDIDSNIQSYNIKKDVSILGVTGNVIELNGEERATTPTKDTQIITPSADKNAITKMTVNPIPDEYIIPSGEIEITANGNYNVTDKASAKVKVPEKQLGAKTITKNGVYNATDDNLDGYSQVTVETSGVDINDYFDKNIIGGNYNNPGWKQNIKKWRSPLYVAEGTNTAYMFRDFPFDETVLPEVIFPSNEVNLYQMFYNANKLKEIPWLINITAKTSMPNAFEGCRNLVKLNKINCEKVTNVSQATAQLNSLVDFGGLENIGKAYSVTGSTNSIYYTITFNSSPNITEQSLINVLNGLYDIATKGCKPQKLLLGSTELSKLTSEEGQTALSNAQAKGWTVS